jgi:hypothetical protein
MSRVYTKNYNPIPFLFENIDRRNLSENHTNLFKNLTCEKHSVRMVTLHVNPVVAPSKEGKT